MSDGPVITRIASGTFLVTVGDTRETVYIAGPPANRWAFWNGQVFHSTGGTGEELRRPAGARGAGALTLTAPMPATVSKVLVIAGARVKKGEPVVVLEAMKMELPIRALEDGTVSAVECRPGELVQADQPLVVME